MSKDLTQLITRAENLIAKLEYALLPAALETDWTATAWRYKAYQPSLFAQNALSHAASGYLQAVAHPHSIRLDDICNIEAQKAEIVRNTQQFINGFPANNVLLTGARGTGKSSLIKALLTEFSEVGLRLVEVDKQDLVALPEIVMLLSHRPERFIIFCDDLSFEASEPSYKALKVVLDGSISVTSDNVLVYATSNRRHLMPETFAENSETKYIGDEIRPGDTTEEKVSLSERFGLWLSFYPFDQDEYLAIAVQWLTHYGIVTADHHLSEEIRQAALMFSHTRGARSGRVAFQFARDYAGKLGLAKQLLSNQINSQKD